MVAKSIRCTAIKLLGFGDLDILDIFSAIISRETTFVSSCFLSYTSSLFQKGVNSKSKEFAPPGANSLLKLTPFSRRQKQFWQIAALERVSIPPKAPLTIAADEKAKIFFIFQENMAWRFMWVICLADNSHKIFSEKKKINKINK